MIRSIALALAVLAGTGAAHAQGRPTAPAAAPTTTPAPGVSAEKPPMAPTKDAVLGYHLAPAAGEAIDARVTFRAAGKGMRMDLPDQTYMLIVPSALSVVLVIPLERTATDLPWSDGPQALFLLDDRMRFTRKGEATVAGQRCSQWEAQLDKIRYQLCISADGLVLRNQFQDAQGRRNLIEAFIVQFQAVPEGDFVVPAGFERLIALPNPPSPQ